MLFCGGPLGHSPSRHGCRGRKAFLCFRLVRVGGLNASRSSFQSPDAPSRSCLHFGHGPGPGFGDRGKHGHIQSGRCCAVAFSSLPGSRAARMGMGEASRGIAKQRFCRFVRVFLSGEDPIGRMVKIPARPCPRRSATQLEPSGYRPILVRRASVARRTALSRRPNSSHP